MKNMSFHVVDTRTRKAGKHADSKSSVSLIGSNMKCLTITRRISLAWCMLVSFGSWIHTNQAFMVDTPILPSQIRIIVTNHHSAHFHALTDQTKRKYSASLTSAHASLNPFATFSNSFAKRQRIREEIEELEEEDFLLADVKPKVLVHERDFFRQATRIQAWDEYVLVSILCTSISYGALQSFTLNPDHEGIFLYEVVVRTMIQTVAGLSALCGLYSTMVFSLSILYGKTALGLERDPLYDSFLEDTGDIRDNAFRAFSLSLALFAVMVVLVLAEDLPLVMHFPVGGIMVAALFVGFRDWKRLVDSAKEIIEED